MIDPLGGSYYVEWLTEKLEQEAYRYFEKIDSAGGLLKAIKSGYLQREIAENSYRLSKRVESGEDAVVGVNKYSIAGGDANQHPQDRLQGAAGQVTGSARSGRGARRRRR